MSESSASIKNCSGGEVEDFSNEVVITDGWSKFRDGKKWKQRWCVLTKLSPAADCLQLQIYRDEKERARNGHTKASLSLQHFLALESGFTLDKESHTMAIICQDLNVVLAFDNRERLIQWNVRIANNLGEGHQFLVQLASAPTKSKLTPGPVKLHVTDRKFCLTGGIPPRLLGAWEVSHLRRYGIVEGRLVFEGGSRCGKGEGVHVLVPDPPQMHLIVEAFDMSAKGQFTRMPSRRFGTDSPRKSMSSRLSEIRNVSILSESSTNVSMGAVTPTNQSSLGLSLMRNMSPTPKESRSAEELCNSCTTSNSSDHNSHALHHNQNSFWMSSDSSSRCDLDSVDNLSMMNCDPREVKSPPTMSSPVKNHPISKPLPSAMERCLSCMSKLGAQGGQDVLSPSWTMDLNGVAATMSTSISQSQVVPKSGSVGSANSDRLSISSHGSSGGVTEFYYDTPRSVILAEMRRNNVRSNTPPVPHNASSNSGLSFNPLVNGTSQAEQCCSGGSGNHSTNSHSSGFHSHTGTSSSPQRHALRNSSGCGFNGCHCHTHGQPGNCPATRAASGQHPQGPIYYNTNDNGACEQQFQPGKSNRSGAKTPINLHPTAYENYDFPRCASQHQPSATNQVNCCANLNGSNPSNGPSPCNNIDWSKKQPMDRSSIASSCAIGSDQMSEFYDTPRRFNEGSCCSHGSNGRPQVSSQGSYCLCCSPQQSCAASIASSSNQPGCHPGHRMVVDPLENYDVPPCSHPLSPPSFQVSNRPQPGSSVGTPNTNMRLNGEGKMPLVTGNLSSIRSSANSMPIYAQVDKSKKTQRMNFATSSSTSSTSNCDSMQHIYQNAQNTFPQIPQQPNYINIEHVKSLPPKKAPILVGHSSNLQRPHGPADSSVVIEDKVPGGNYVNMDFSDSLCLYENSKDVRSSRLALAGGGAEGKLSVTTGHNDLVADKNPGIENPELSLSHAKLESSECVPETQDQNDESSGAEAVSESSSKTLHSEIDDGASLPLRRSSSVPCKGGHANRGSASSSDSGVSGDGGLFFEDGSPLGDFGSLCLHESLPRKNQRSSPSSSTGGKNTSTTSTPKPQDAMEVEAEPETAPSANPIYSTPNEKLVETPPDVVNNNDSLANRHYETIDEVDPSKAPAPLMMTSVPTVRESHHLQRPRNHPLTIVSDANSTSSGASDMSDYIETLSSCSRGSSDIVNNHLNPAFGLHHSVVNSVDISASPKRSSSMKPRSGKEYFKIDRSAFTKSD